MDAFSKSRSRRGVLKTAAGLGAAAYAGNMAWSPAVGA